MKYIEIERQHESTNSVLLESPVIESFADATKVAEVWPEEIATNRVFLEQLKERSELNQRLNYILDCLPRPDISLEAAITQGSITEQQVAKLYESFNELLNKGRDYARFILYCPFEFLPTASSSYSTKELNQASIDFKKSYMEAWRSLLSVHDVRANFVDGDVLEVEQRQDDLPRVVKAAHLIPKLVEHGLIKIEEVVALIEESNDQVLKNSIADALSVLADLSFITKKEFNILMESKDPFVVDIARTIASNMEAKKVEPEEKLETATFLSIQKELNKECDSIEAEKYDGLTKKRQTWLREKKRQTVIEAQSDIISRSIQENKFTITEASNFLTTEANAVSQQTLIEGIRKAVEMVALNNPKEAQALYNNYQETLLTLWKTNDPNTKETIIKIFRRLKHLNIIDNKQLIELDIVTPKLAGPFSENLQLMKKEIDNIRETIASVELNPELSQLIYPVVLAFGSRLKGYGESNSDIDMAVYVKPGMPFNERAKLQGLLNKTFSHEKIRGEIIEFWLEEKGDKLNIRNFKETDSQLGESYWAHIIFGAAWLGKKEVINELQKKILPSYIYETDLVIHDHPARNLYLEEMERDILQYRLMHKGYEKNFPSFGGIHITHADKIDGNSIFWDSGYRQLAIKLFTSRVFLPKIPTSKK